MSSTTPPAHRLERRERRRQRTSRDQRSLWGYADTDLLVFNWYICRIVGEAIRDMLEWKVLPPEKRATELARNLKEASGHLLEYVADVAPDYAMTMRAKGALHFVADNFEQLKGK